MAHSSRSLVLFAVLLLSFTVTATKAWSQSTKLQVEDEFFGPEEGEAEESEDDGLGGDGLGGDGLGGDGLGGDGLGGDGLGEDADGYVSDDDEDENELGDEPESKTASEKAPAPTKTPPKDLPSYGRRQSPEGGVSQPGEGGAVIQREGKKYIEHPLATKGLTKITKDKVYIYRVRESERSRSASFRIGLFDPVNLENDDFDNTRTFTSIYPESQQPMLLFDYEWKLLESFGDIGLKVGTGLYTTSGNGRFDEDDDVARETFTFYALPNALSLIYRFWFWDQQWVVPYVEGGGLAITFVELRDDDQPPKGGVAWGAFATGGIALDLSRVNPKAMVEMDREYGINQMWFLLEVRQQVGLSSLDFTGTLINGGFLLDF